MEVYAALTQESCAQTLPAAFLVAGNAAPLKKVSPALFITLLIIDTEAAGFVTAAVGPGREVVAEDPIIADSPLQCIRLLLLLLRRKSIAGGVWSTTLTSPQCFCAAIAFAKVIGLFDPSSVQYLTSPVSGITF